MAEEPLEAEESEEEGGAVAEPGVFGVAEVEEPALAGDFDAALAEFVEFPLDVYSQDSHVDSCAFTLASYDDGQSVAAPFQGSPGKCTINCDETMGASASGSHL